MVGISTIMGCVHKKYCNPPLSLVALVLLSTAAVTASSSTVNHQKLSPHSLGHETSDGQQQKPSYELALRPVGTKDDQEAELRHGDGAVRLKRAGHSWSSLQGSWGKRGQQVAPGWSNFRGSWGKKADWSSLRGSWGKRSNDAESVKRATDWSSLRGTWGKRFANSGDKVPVAEDVEDFDPAIIELAYILTRTRNRDDNGRQISLNPYPYIGGEEVTTLSETPQREAGDDSIMPVPDVEEVENYHDDDDESDPSTMDKRAQYINPGGWLLKRPDGRLLLSPRSVNWSSLRGTWGKRSGGNWSQLRGTWGKRGGGTNWSNLRGTWGKREPTNNWGSFRGSWGKRNLGTDEQVSDATNKVEP